MTASQRRWLIAVALTLVAADAGTKVAALRWFAQPVAVGPLDLRVTYNTGVAFGLGADLPVAVVAAVTGLVVLVLGVAAWRGHLGGPLPAGLIVGGGFANLADRVVGGSVVDVFDLGWWPVFNLADVFLTAGVILLLLGSITSDDDRDDHATATDQPGTADIPVGGHE